MNFQRMPRKLWEHPNPQSTPTWKFMQHANTEYGLNMKGFPDLYEWSCKERNQFWDLFWRTQPFIYEGTYTKPVDESAPISQLPKWFDGVRLNWAENFLWSRSLDDPTGERTMLHKEDDTLAVTEVREGNTEVKQVTWKMLRKQTAEMATALKVNGIGPGDRVVVVGSHSLQTLVVFLATTWLGAVFSSSSTDMGAEGLLQRTSQIDPKIVFFDDGALYNGHMIDLQRKIQIVTEGLRKQCPSFQSGILIQRFADNHFPTASVFKTERLQEFLLSAVDKKAPPFARVAFQDPVVIYYSSGTTGIPKAIVHGVGPLLLNCRKEGILHRCITPDNIGLQYATTGWIVYLSSVTGLLFGSKVILYDGSPLRPDPSVLLRIVEQHSVTTLGVGPRWMGELMKRAIVPRESFDLSKLTQVISTGMLLPEQTFEWFYDVGFPLRTQLANISGGTDIAGCFLLDNPLQPVYVGGCVGRALGISIELYDSSLPDGSDGRALPLGEAGDLVATCAFPNVPLYLWNDNLPAPGKKYRGAYFERFKDVWAHGDYCVFHPTTGGIVILGRSDGVLNPGGVRFGSSDIYNVLEKCFSDDIAESLCVGQRRPSDTDVAVVLFVVMKSGKRLDKSMVQTLKGTIARELTKRHVPKYIFETPDIPVTVNGKKAELPVKAILSGKTIQPSSTLLNPGSLAFFYRFYKIEDIEDSTAKL